MSGWIWALLIMLVIGVIFFYTTNHIVDKATKTLKENPQLLSLLL